ncbi:hypothetical protein BS643_15880 [Pseudomonas protegens]|uniref:hypothetical protein n=1 Tax=Pseudomonas TaxID=286 RepID=UPI0008070AD3|nr:hypothetical protein [Pseudomonas protegens]OBZ24155.1 hypothetical protein BBH58_25915 [Pseudomonas protegens]OBZ29448.1 hypothetical protein BBH57_06025 [Pseudomonas protegens]OKK45216.1 hypothetical protein BS643_15880 [Pseudomonas protegens]OKK51252.1 hypothetical protein BS644_06675 [Pseudomonas protegens]OKK57453.1 hypothetical protein BS645_26155 [Pseudomonas protegens]
MRWLFLLLLVLNGFYYIWHQQEAPLRAKEVVPLSLYRGTQQDIRLLSESSDSVERRDKGKSGEIDASCLYLGGFARRDTAQMLEQRLVGLGADVRLQSLSVPGSSGFWLRVTPESKHLLDDLQLQNLAKEFNELKHKIMPCEGVATVE